jgi:TonB-dependent starch-binding outer membrane protein SusC
VLKDASATAIYGSRASAGVILITTKKGKVGRKLTLGYAANVSLGKIAKRVDVLTADEFRATVEKDVNFAKIKPLLGKASTDWQDVIFQNALSTDHTLFASGAVKFLPYRVSLGYTKQNGLLKTDNFNRYTTAINLSPNFLNNTLQFNLNFKSQNAKNHFADRGAIGSALSWDPTQSPRATFMLDIRLGNPSIVLHRRDLYPINSRRTTLFRC